MEATATTRRDLLWLVPADPILLNYGIIGVVAFIAGIAWSLVLHGPLGRVLDVVSWN